MSVGRDGEHGRLLCAAGISNGAYCCDVELDGTQTCFVVMPISVPDHLLDRYDGGSDHFIKIYKSLISPAIIAAGLVPRPTSRMGTENIPAAIINDLRDSDLVLADLSVLNPNVFLELGIRSALDRPVCLVWDGLDSLPFDSRTLNTHEYASRPMYELNEEIERMGEFIKATITKSDGRNELWKFFGTASTALPTAELDPTDASFHSKLDRLLELAERASMLDNRVASLEALTRPRVREVREVAKLREQAHYGSTRGGRPQSAGVPSSYARVLFGDRLSSIKVESDGHSTLNVLEDRSERYNDHENVLDLEKRFRVPVEISYMTRSEFDAEQERMNAENKR
jgi:hypothetical protein